MGYLYLLVAIAAEVAATVSLRLSAGFTRVLPTLGALAGFGAALWLLSLAMRSVPLSISYPLWAGLGSVGALTVAYLVFGERLVAVQWAGVALVLLGVVLVNAPKAAEVAA